jgi:hypothetical protein
MFDFKKLIDQARGFSYYYVTRPFPNRAYLMGQVPFTMIIENGQVTAQIKAKSEQDALRELDNYLHEQGIV